MPVHLVTFPLVIPREAEHISFHDGFGDARHELGHSAIDIGAPAGTSIVSATNGMVIHQWVTQRDRRVMSGCGWSDRGGNVVVVIDPQGYAHYYAHMGTSPLVAPGSCIVAGTRLGFVSNTGSAASGGSNHLHYQVWPIGQNRDEEWATGIFTRPFGRAVNAFSELRRLAEPLGARVGERSVIWGGSRRGSRH